MRACISRVCILHKLMPACKQAFRGVMCQRSVCEKGKGDAKRACIFRHVYEWFWQLIYPTCITAITTAKVINRKTKLRSLIHSRFRRGQTCWRVLLLSGGSGTKRNYNNKKKIMSIKPLEFRNTKREKALASRIKFSLASHCHPE